MIPAPARIEHLGEDGAEGRADDSGQDPAIGVDGVDALPQRSGTSSGKRLRRPLLLNGPVRDEIVTMARSSQAGRSPAKESVATRSSEVEARSSRG